MIRDPIIRPDPTRRRRPSRAAVIVAWSLFITGVMCGAFAATVAWLVIR